MTEKITLELTLEELKLIDKHLWISVATKPILEKIKNAYPKQRMELERTGKVSVVFYDKKPYYRIEYGDEFHYTVWWERTKQDDTSQLTMITDKETERLLEGMFFNDVRGGQVEETFPADWYDDVEWTDKNTPIVTDEVVNRLMEKWKTDPPEFLKFEMGKTLEELITRWWRDVFGGINSHWDMETAIADLVDRIQLWLPKEQSAEGSQNVDTMLLVDGFNDAIAKIKSKLR